MSEKSVPPIRPARAASAPPGRQRAATKPPKATTAPRAADAGRDLVVLAAIVGAHGVGGAVRVKSFTGDLGAFRDVEVVGRPFTIERVRPAGQLLSVRLGGLDDRDAAEALRGQTISVARAALPALAADEYYHADLIGLAAVDETGVALGIVVAVENYGASDVIEVERPDGKRFMVPMIPAAVPEWNAERIVIHSTFADA